MTAPRRHWFRFSLRAMLLLVLAGGVAIGWTMHKVREQGRAVSALEKLGCRVFYVGGESPDLLERLKSLLDAGEPRNATSLMASQSYVTDADLLSLKALPQLTDVRLGGTDVTDAGITHLAGLARLTSLDLSRTRVTDAGLAHLRDLNELEWLRMDGTQVTDAGLAHLQRFSQLRLLDLYLTRVTDAGLVHLGWFSRLQSLNLKRTRVTDAGVQELKQALPNCQIIR
jgi:hypothetical protein